MYDRGYVWDFGKIDVLFIVCFRLIESSSYFISVVDVVFIDCKRGKVDMFLVMFFLCYLCIGIKCKDFNIKVIEFYI